MKVKKWLLGFATFAAMAVLCAICAGAEYYWDYEYSVLDDGTVEITDYNGSAEKIDIPEKIDGKSVTSIGYWAFEDCTSLKSITIPNGVTHIDIFAFEGCTSLTNITIPDSVTSIEDCAFYDCTSLAHITIPSGVAYINDNPFEGCSSLTEIRVATENAKYVSVNGVLYNKNKTTLVCYPAGKKDKSYKIINSATSIGESAFSTCDSLTSITIPNNVTSIGGDAFGDCSSLTSITIPNSVTSIDFGAFNHCTNLESIAIPDSVTGINYRVFEGCTSLTSITIPNKVTSIDGRAFSDCSSLTSITIPDSVSSIGNYAFYGCTSLKSITIPDSVTGINYGVFEGCTSLTSITIPNSVTDIDDSAFSGCKSLTSIKIPNSVVRIGSSAFVACTSLTRITIPNGVKSIELSAFVRCTSLTSVTIPDSVTFISGEAFGSCTNLKSITIPKSVTVIGDNAFGYYYDNGYKKINDFKIYCYPGTAGEKYAKDNGFTYELLDQPTISNVTGFKVKSLTSTNVTLQWHKNSSASGYEIEQYKSGKWVNVAKITGNATTSYTVKGLAAGTAGYKFRMRAVKNGTYSDYTSALSVNTNPYGVGGFKCSSKSSTSVTLKWNKGTTASGYQLQQYKDGKWVTIYTGTKATNTSYTVKGLKAGTAGYRFRIRAYKTYGNTKQYGSWSSEVKVNTNPYGVSGFKCSSKTSTSVTLKWNKGTTASGYQLQQYKDGKWVTIYTGTKATNTSYTVKGLKAGTAGYRFRIRAYKTYGNTKQYGSWSSEVKVNTNPYGVGGFKAKSTAKTSITLGWNKGTTASGYQLQQYKGGKWVTVYTGTKATSTSCTVKSLKANTSYKFKIRAYKTYGNTKQYGSWSSTLTVKTKR